MRIWVSKPIYETLPYFYLAAGAACLVASLYLNYWYWPTICLIFGIASQLDPIVGKHAHQTDFLDASRVSGLQQRFL